MKLTWNWNKWPKTMKWEIEYLEEARRDLKRMDSYSARLVVKEIEKTAERSLPPPEGIGKPLGNHTSSRLGGYYKIKLKSMVYRVVYGLVREHNVMKIIVISIRDDETVYKEAERRIKK